MKMSMTDAVSATARQPFREARGAPDADHASPSVAEVVRIGLVGVAVILTWFRVWAPLARVDLVALGATLLGGYPIFREALEALLERRMTMELSMTIALAAALAIGEFFTALVIVLFVLVAEVLEHLTIGRGRRAIRDLLDFLPRLAAVRRGGDTREVDACSIEAGDVVLVRPGSRIAVDGAVIAGHSFVDQATITGESMPVEKLPGSRVYAGTMNQSGALEVRAVRLGRDTAFGKIIEAVERAEQSRAPIQKTADRLAGYLVYFALAAAAVTLVLTRDARATISVVIVAGACGIAAGTPLAILGAIGQAARRGAIVKGGLHLEALAKVDTVVFDKTGTLTFGAPEVVDVRPVASLRPEDVLEAAAVAEVRSEHPLARAVRKRAAGLSARIDHPETFDYTPGLGVVCSLGGETIVVGNEALLVSHGIAVTGSTTGDRRGTEIFVARGGRFLGVIEVADVVRAEARHAVDALHAWGIETILLTGDATPIAAAVGRDIGVDFVAAELLPDDKVRAIAALREQGKRVVMVGDGVNDAPALMEADVGVGMGSGTDVARETADVMLLGDDLMTLVETLRIARRCRRIILENFIGTLAIDGVGVGLAAFGFLDPLLAAFIHVSSELAFILNSARLLRRGAPAPAAPHFVGRRSR
jgi:Cd2+/Zn2+-exporting ATPase/Cu+-exporting ATPase